ncbi:MAG: DUF6485 family protein [Promethearchaeota archaeon]
MGICENDSNDCPCTFSCSHHGKCCECIRYHRRRNELPACYFSTEEEKTGDRSIENFINDYKKNSGLVNT